MSKKKRTRSKAPARIKRDRKTFYRSRKIGFEKWYEANTYAQKRVRKGKAVRIIHLRSKGELEKPYFVYERRAWWKHKKRSNQKKK